MALMKCGNLVSRVAGSVGGATFTGVRGGLSVQSRGAGRVGVRGHPADDSRAFGQVSRFWGELAPEVRLEWDTAGGGYGRGQALFMSVVCRRFRFGGSWYLAVPQPGIVESPGVVTLSSSAAAQSFLIAWSGRPVAESTEVVFWFSVFASAAEGESVYGWHGPYYCGAAADGSVDVGPAIFASVSVCQPGRALGVRVAFWRTLVGKLSGRLEARCVVTA